LAQLQFAKFVRTLSERLISDMSLQVFGFTKGSAFGEGRRILLQDGTSFAIHDALRAVFPGWVDRSTP
jgi:hypothetical protein